MTTVTNETELGEQFEIRQRTIDKALKHIGEAVHIRRSLLGIRQSDLQERTGIQSSQISRVESGVVNIRLSTIITLLDELGLLDSVLNALPIKDGNEVGERVCTPAQTDMTAEAAMRPLSVGQFLTMFDHDPSVELPVSTRASIELRKRGFAARQCEHPKLGVISYVTSMENALYSEHEYLVDGGTTVGGYKHLSLVVAGKAMRNDVMTDAAPLLLSNIIERVNAVVDTLKLRVVSAVFDADSTAHVVTLNDEVIDSVYVYDKICDVINAGEWL